MDILGKRYGWSYREITDHMYWEEVYRMYEYASNHSIIEQNDEMKFHFMLHAQTEEALNGWKDTPIPFPDRDWKPEEEVPTISETYGDTFGKFVHRVKMNDDDRKRFEELKEKWRVHNETMKKLRSRK